MSNFKEKIDEAKTAIQHAQELETRANQLRNEARSILLDCALMQHGLEIGKTMVVNRWGDKFLLVSLGGVTAYDIEHAEKPWASGRKITKDGNPSKRIQSLYKDWTKA